MKKYLLATMLGFFCLTSPVVLQANDETQKEQKEEYASVFVREPFVCDLGRVFVCYGAAHCYLNSWDNLKAGYLGSSGLYFLLGAFLTRIALRDPEIKMKKIK